MAQNLSSVPAVQTGDLSRVFVTWDNGVNFGTATGLSTAGDVGNPYNFTIDVACQSLSSTSLPSSWATKASVTGNTLRSRSFLINMTDSATGGGVCNGDYNWIRINATSGFPGGWQNWQGKFDIWDASRSANDSWMFYGDSITANDSEDKDQAWGQNFAKQINAWNPNYYPSVEMGGMGGRWAVDYAKWTESPSGYSDSTPWLPKTPAHFFVLGLGTNDCNSGGTSGYRGALNTLIDNVMASDPTRVVIIPTLPASPALRSGTNTVNMNGTPTQVNGNGQGPICNSIIAQAIAAKQMQYGSSHVLVGPDLWSALSIPTSEWSDSLHPAGDANGMGIMRTTWVRWAEANVYPPPP